MSGRRMERLSAQDASFLVFEGPNTPMNVGGTMIFEAGPLETAEGGVDVDRIRRHIEARLKVVPRYRQRLEYSPLTGHPFWVDDDRFNVHYHVRHTSLPRPGSDAQLKELSARIMALPLDRRRPLWETWIVEGLHNGCFAMVTKTHHCAVDGVTGVDLVASLMELTPEASVEERSEWHPRRRPSGFELMAEEVAHRASLGRRVVDALRDVGRQPTRALEQVGGNLAAALEMLNAGLRGAAQTPLNRSIGPHRCFDWVSFRLDEVKEVKNLLGGTVNDVVLATVAGALRNFLGDDLSKADAENFRALVPVNMRTPAERNVGNRVSAWLTSLPIQERDPLLRFAGVRKMTAHLKESGQASATELLGGVVEWTDALLSLGVRLTAQIQPYNLLVTNVAGPSFPMFLLGSRMLAGYPQVPLFENQGLGVALFSYDGKLFWGFNGDWDLMQNLASFTRAVEVSFRELRRAALSHSGAGTRVRGAKGVRRRPARARRKQRAG